MNKAVCAAWCFALIFALLVVAGCGDSNGDLARVRGRITLNGEPLKNAIVEFDPEKGSTSHGETDGSGYYELEFGPGKRGAVIGMHIVRISTRRMYTDDDGTEHEEPEILPPQFNHKSILLKEVKPGTNTIDFPLEAPSLSGGDRKK